MGGGSGETTQLPWAPQGQEFKTLYDEANKILGKELEYFPGSTVAPRNAWQTMANQNVAGMVNQGSAGLESAVAENLRTTSGQYLDVGSNPHLRGVGDAAGVAVGSGVLVGCGVGVGGGWLTTRVASSQ